jgi:hypothetical protein
MAALVRPIRVVDCPGLAGLSLPNRADGRMSTHDPFPPLTRGSYRVFEIRGTRRKASKIVQGEII